MSPSGMKLRVPIPDGVVEGQKMRVKTAPGKSAVVETPPKDQWKVDDNGKNYFSYTYVEEEEPEEAPPAPVPVAAPQSADLEAERILNRMQDLPPFVPFDEFQPEAFAGVPNGVKTVTTDPSKEFVPTGRTKALLIGINYQGTDAELRGCVNDVFEMRKHLLTNGFNDGDNHMVILVDAPGPGLSMTESKYPNKINIMKGMQWLLQGAVPGDILFFQFSGHGGQQKDEHGIESDGLNETILPADFQSHGQISDDVIWASLVYPLPEGVKLISLMDSCHSGTGLDLPYNYILKESRWKEDLNPSHSAGDVIQISGCEDSQLSADAATGSKPNGAMTTAFVTSLVANPNGTYEEILNGMHSNLKQLGFKQIPQLTSSQRFDAKEKLFSFTSGIEPNRNTTIGRVVRRRNAKKKSWFQQLCSC